LQIPILWRYFAAFINLLFVITKAGGNRPVESLATLCQKKVLHSISIYGEQITPRILLTFTITYYNFYERLACAVAVIHIPAVRTTR